MKARFQIASVSDGVIAVDHRREGHRYSFLIVKDEEGRRALSESIHLSNGRSSASPARCFLYAARRFAAITALRAGLID